MRHILKVSSSKYTQLPLISLAKPHQFRFRVCNSVAKFPKRWSITCLPNFSNKHIPPSVQLKFAHSQFIYLSIHPANLVPLQYSSWSRSIGIWMSSEALISHTALRCFLADRFYQTDWLNGTRVRHCLRSSSRFTVSSTTWRVDGWFIFPTKAMLHAGQVNDY